MLASTFLAIWWCCTLLAGLWVHVPILGLAVLLLWPAALGSWFAFFAVLRPAAESPAGHRLVAKIAAWVSGLGGGFLLTTTVLFIGGFVGDELLALQRKFFELDSLKITRRVEGLELLAPFVSQSGWKLLGLMVLWLAEVLLACLAIRLRAGWERRRLLVFAAALFPIPPLIPYLVLLFDLPLTA